MRYKAETVQSIVAELRSGQQSRQVQAALQLRTLAAETQHKDVIREADGIGALLQLLDSSCQDVLVTVCTETLSCLAAEDLQNREAIRAADGIRKLVGLLSAAPDCIHRALLALRILADCEADRVAILEAGGVPQLVHLLSAGPVSEVTEFAAAALGNLAAGGRKLKDAIREAGGVQPLVSLLHEGWPTTAAELAAVALRNMCLQSQLSREAIIAAGGVSPLLRLLSSGQQLLVQPLQCEAVYKDINPEAADGSQHFVATQCCFDPRHAELCIASLMGETSLFGCFAKTEKDISPTDRTAERYSMMRKLTLTEPDPNTLVLSFNVAGLDGAPRTVNHSQKVPSRWLQRIIICPCIALDTKGAIMRMLTRMQLERQFKAVKSAKQTTLGGNSFDASRLHLSEMLQRAREAIAA